MGCRLVIKQEKYYRQAVYRMILGNEVSKQGSLKAVFKPEGARNALNQK